MDIEVRGECACAVIHAIDDAEAAADQYALAQVQMLCDNEAFEGAQVRLMPDVHAGKVGPVGLAVSYPEEVRGCEGETFVGGLTDQKILPGLLGNDIGCGVSYVCFKPKKRNVDFARLDKFIRAEIAPRTRRIDEDEIKRVMGIMNFRYKAPDSYCNPLSGAASSAQTFMTGGKSQAGRAVSTFGTLGGGNHFIEVGCGSDGSYWLMVHSGSRNLGNQVYEYYMDEGQKELKRRGLDIPYEMTWLDGNLRNAYVLDTQHACEFAALSRLHIIESIMKHMKWKPCDSSGGLPDAVRTCPHNYIQDGVIRKGAISANEGEDVVIPINMRDGIIIGKGKGNADWNFSAPHGSGRLLKRSDVSSAHTVSEFKKEMDGIWTTCANKETLDEAPFAYRGIDQIRDALEDAVEITDVVKPLYSFKGQGGKR